MLSCYLRQYISSHPNFYKWALSLFLIYSFDNDNMISSKWHVALLSLIFLLICFSKLFFSLRKFINFFFCFGFLCEAPNHIEANRPVLSRSNPTDIHGEIFSGVCKSQCFRQFCSKVQTNLYSSSMKLL